MYITFTLYVYYTCMFVCVCHKGCCRDSSGPWMLQTETNENEVTKCSESSHPSPYLSLQDMDFWVCNTYVFNLCSKHVQQISTNHILGLIWCRPSHPSFTVLRPSLHQVYPSQPCNPGTSADFTSILMATDTLVGKCTPPQTVLVSWSVTSGEKIIQKSSDGTPNGTPNGCAKECPRVTSKHIKTVGSKISRTLGFEYFQSPQGQVATNLTNFSIHQLPQLQHPSVPIIKMF